MTDREKASPVTHFSFLAECDQGTFDWQLLIPFEIRWPGETGLF